MKRILIGVSLALWLITAIICYFMPDAASFVSLGVTSLILAVTLYDSFQKKHSLLRNYPLVARLRWVFEGERDKIKQYFIESDLDGTPINREKRSIIYQRAKRQIETIPFGTQHDVYQKGYEFVKHALFPLNHHHITGERLTIGNEHCKQPYSSSILNISAMSFGSLSKAAITALNQGAKLGDFAHNTGEGGISPYHLQGGDLIFQVGTGYFGAGKTDENGERIFDSECFKNNAIRPEVKLIEIKLSQGAKPGHGGILPAVKLTQEIADIRHVSLGKDVISPAAHTAFSTPTEMMLFVQKLRELSGGKPIGFKLCIGKKSEFISVCKAMLSTGIKPDFITIDGSEGGPGAAPIELTNSVGTPIRDAIIFVNQTLIGMGLRDDIRVIASGKVLSAFHLLKLIALGADSVNSARAMLFSLGCIQSRSCNTDMCPTGIATQNPARVKALVVEDKVIRVANYHRQMMKHLVELLGAAGLQKLSDLKPEHIMHRVQGTNIQSYESMFPSIEPGCLLNETDRPNGWYTDWQQASETTW